MVIWFEFVLDNPHIYSSESLSVCADDSLGTVFVPIRVLEML